MMVRTIQHPGVQIAESEIGSYTGTVIMNNAYIMGFADRGPIYDYSWITTTSEFNKIYGEPQTEAEKYLFTAVQSVLQNGGTPIVARMPYDNKQCKAYKAVKFRWADDTPAINTDLSSPIVPLSAVAARINSDKSFAEIFNVDSVTVNDENVSRSFIESLTIDQVLKQLNPYEVGSATSEGTIWDDLITGLKINGVYPSGLAIEQAAVSSMVASLNRDQTECVKTFYKYDEGLNICQYDSEDDIVNRFPRREDEFFKINDKYIGFSWIDEKTDSLTGALVSLFNTAPADGIAYNTPCYNRSEIPAELQTIFQGIMEEYVPTGIVKFVADEDGETFGIESAVDDDNDFLINLIDAVKSMPKTDDYAQQFYFLEGDTVAYVLAYDVNDKEYYIKPTIIDDDGTFNAYQMAEATKTAISNYVVSPYSKELYPVSGFAAIFGEPLSTPQIRVNGFLQDITPVSSTVEIGQLVPLYTNTYNGYAIVDGEVDVDGGFITFESIRADIGNHELVGFYNFDIESPAVSGTIKGVDLINLNIPGLDPEQTYNVYSESCLENGVIPQLVPAGDDAEKKMIINTKDASSETGFSVTNFKNIDVIGTIDVADFSFIVKYASSLKNMPIVDVDNDVLVQNEQLVWLKTIYNNPYFLKLDEAEYAALEASLMNTPEMGFKYGLYLDSEDCEISNNQYDDLVTVNQFTAVDRSIDKYGQDIDDANYIIVDKQKTVVQGAGGNIGYFTTIIDPFDALKVQRTLVNPEEKNASSRTITGKNTDGETTTVEVKFNHTASNIARLDYWAYESADAWNQIYDDLIDSMDCLQRVRNADGIYIGEPNPIDGKLNILDSWAVPLTGGYYDESISKNLMRKFPAIALASVNADDLDSPDYKPSIIDHNFATHITVAVCKTTIDQSTGKIVVQLVETFFGSLFNEKNLQNGRSLFIGDIINANSDFIEFYRNNFVSAGDNDAYAPPEYRRTPVNQIFLKDTDELKSAAMMRGIDYEEYGCTALDPEVREEGERNYYADLEKKHIYAIDKKEVCIYNLRWEANLTSFSKKESQKVIANTTGLYSIADGTTINVAKNFLVDMDRCINFIKNIDDIPLHFICDAGLSTIAQFCDNVIWNPNKKTIVGEKTDANGKKTGVKIYETTGGWITQPFDPDNDPDGDDRYITGYEDVATWRRVVEKIGSIAGEVRKDCFAIVDAPRQLTLDGAAPKIRRTKFTNNFDKTIGKPMRYITGINSSYMAGYYNWLRTTDQYSGRSIWIPPTTKIIGNYCYLNIINLPWLAPAGLTYGLISGCSAVSHNPDYQEEDQIYMKSWNYIKQYPMEGLVVEGQKTLLGKESAFERVNVRLLFLDLERFAYNVSKTFKYQVNNSYTREQFVQTLKPKFEDYTLRGGIYEYLIKCDSQNNTPETIDANELRGDIFIKPARLIEFILLNFTATSTGTNFNELQLG